MTLSLDGIRSGLRAVPWLPWAAGLVLWVVGVGLALAPLAAREGTTVWDPWLARTGAVVATWCAVVLLAHRLGGPMPLVAGFSAGCVLVVLLLPWAWVLSAAAMVAAVAYGLLGMSMTRPARGVRSAGEGLVAAASGVVGTVVVTGYDVGVRPHRFRMIALALALLGGLAIARRMGLGWHSLGRRGVAVIVGTLVVVLVTMVYVHLVHNWGSSQVMHSLTGSRGTLREWLGVSPRPIEALVGFPALVWGAAVRSRRRQGWWVSAFGALAATGVATSLVQRSVSIGAAAAATGYDLLIGTALGLLLVGLDRMLTGDGLRRRVGPAGDRVRREPARTASLL